jgi:hypothetical protein
MTALARTNSNFKRQTRPLVRDDYDYRKSSAGKQILAVSLKGLDAKTN